MEKCAEKCREEHKENCKGVVAYRLVESETSKSGYKSYPYCDFHWEERVMRDQAHRERYPVNSPPDFDPADCGEVWSEDDY